METKTYTEAQIRDAVLEHDEGCFEGKARFLADAFGIEANPTQTVVVRVSITLPSFTTSGEEVDSYAIDGAVESVLDSHLPGELDVEEVDART